MKLRSLEGLRQTPPMSFRARSRSRSLRLLLAALLLFSQHQAVLHLLGHGLAQIAQQESTDPQELVCAKCLAIAHLDHAVDVVVPTFEPVVFATAPIDSATVPTIDPAFFASYRSRAPPAVS